MLIRELTSSQCAELLSRTTIGRLACAHNGQPYIVPISFSYDAEDRCVYGFSPVGQKVLWMRENPRVCLEVEEIVDKNHWQTVVVYGWYEELIDTPAHAAARKRAHDLFEQRTEWWLPAAGRLPTREPYAGVIYRIHIDRMTGRRAARNPPAG